jgi:hypothetical protein
MTDGYIERQEYIDSLRECVAIRSELYEDQPWEAHISEGIVRFGGSEVVRITDFIQRKYGAPGKELELDWADRHAALYMFVKLHLIDAGLAEPFPSRQS